MTCRRKFSLSLSLSVSSLLFTGGLAPPVRAQSNLQCRLLPTGLNQYGHYGSAVAFGDIDPTTTRFEAVVGHPGYDSGGVTDQGSVVVYDLGSYGTCADDVLLYTLVLTGSGANAGDKLGMSVAVGDLNGDGLADIAAGAPNAILVDQSGTQLPDAGKVVIWWNDPDPSAAFQTQLVLKRPILKGNTEFGFSLAIGDVDGDSNTCKELVIGAPKYDADSLTQDVGEVWVWRSCGSGTDGGGGIPGMTGFERIVNPHPNIGEEFGYSVAVFDISDEGPVVPDPQPCNEVLIGVPMEIAPGGSGNPEGGVFVDSFCDRASYWLRESTPETRSRFGHSVAAGYTFEDIDADDTPVWAPIVVVGAPDATNVTTGLQTGEAHAFLPVLGSPFADLIISSPWGTVFGRFGEAVAVGDLNNDGYDDFLIGGPDQEDTCTGGLVAKFGNVWYDLAPFLGFWNPILVRESFICTQDFPGCPDESYTRYGAALAAVVDPNPDLGNMQGTSVPARDALVGGPDASFPSCLLMSGTKSGRATAHEDFQ